MMIVLDNITLRPGVLPSGVRLLTRLWPQLWTNLHQIWNTASP